MLFGEREEMEERAEVEYAEMALEARDGEGRGRGGSEGQDVADEEVYIFDATTFWLLCSLPAGAGAGARAGAGVDMIAEQCVAKGEKSLI